MVSAALPDRFLKVAFGALAGQMVAATEREYRALDR
jgi:hypothetical protein